MPNTKVTVHYVITNNGDGSVSLHWCKNALEAQLYDEWRQRSDGWGEEEAFSEELEFDENGQMLNTFDLRAEMEQTIDFALRYGNNVKEIKSAKKILKVLDQHLPNES